MGNSVGARTADGPYFFLSYAHTPTRNEPEQADPDYWMAQLFRDLCQHMTEMLDVPPGAVTDLGFMDRELRPGNEWPQALAEALATCRVFVPLYSRRYFASASCGREWSAYTRRATRHQRAGRGRARAIVPALWVPVRDPLVPEAARDIPADADGIYAERGFYGIMKLSRYHDEYEDAVHRLARQIVAAGAGSTLPPGSPAKYEKLENAFGSVASAADGGRRVLLTIATADSRSGWTPYPDDSSRPLAEEVADLATGLGYQPEVGGLAEHADELISQETTRPIVLIVDPWAVTVPETKEILQQIDSSGKQWISVVVAGPKDTEHDWLRAALQETLPRKLIEGRATSALATKGVPTLADFTTVVPLVLRAAERSFLRFAPTRDPVVK